MFFLALEHEKVCLHPKKSGAEVMFALQANDAHLNEERKLFSTLIELLSYEKIIFNGISQFSCFVRSIRYERILFYFSMPKIQIYNWNHIVLMSTYTNCFTKHLASQHSIISGWWRRGSIMLNVIHIQSMIEDSLTRYVKLIIFFF